MEFLIGEIIFLPFEHRLCLGRDHASICLVALVNIVHADVGVVEASKAGDEICNCLAGCIFINYWRYKVCFFSYIRHFAAIAGHFMVLAHPGESGENVLEVLCLGKS